MAISLPMSTLRCLDCGKCTSICPIARYGITMLSPRRLIRQVSVGDAATPESVWNCLTCALCDTACPQEVQISEAVPVLRAQVRKMGLRPPFTRCAAMESIATIQSQASLPQNRLEWLTGDLRTDPESKVMLFVGCLPYFDRFFVENGVNTLDSARAAIRILNALGIEPAVLAEERCCGHDALWAGDEKTFRDLAEMNRAMIEKLDPKLIVTVCPECSLTLSQHYMEYLGTSFRKVQTLGEFLAEHKGELALRENETSVTFQDPCRLGRFQDVYDEPREALGMVPGIEIREMEHSRERGTCCTGSWLTCNQASKKIQADRLSEARATGGAKLVTACPKCQIHLKCAQTGEGEELGIEIVDLGVLFAESLK
jgi:heterodisulfide reductase subunit D